MGEMKSDLTKVRQALFNLLGNASKFTENGTITLKVSKIASDKGSWIAFHVIDTGIGMSEEHQAKLFQAFTQADASITREFGGTGLGLTISKLFCNMLGGTIEVESELGKGSRFTIYLPIHTQEDEHEKSFTKKPLLTNEKPLQNAVLVIDNEEDVREMLRSYIEKTGCPTLLAESGEEGLHLARTYKPQLIILDIIMPGMDGWSVLASIKSDEKLRDIPVLLFSMSEHKDKGYSLGATDFLTKPVDKNHLEHILSKYTSKENESCHVLIVEDDHDTQDLMEQMITREDCEPFIVSNGVEALERLKVKIPDIILLDLMMPEMDGFEFIDHIQQNENWNEIPIIVVTAKDITLEEQQRLSGNVEKIFQKGNFDQKQIYEELQKQVSYRLEKVN